ncbi:MAG TPA: hypothetical protein DEG96_02680 [Candidatus Atribacteria bacterium]|nr:hypothetical protein [Candidatus Atribacteria bacterium]
MKYKHAIIFILLILSISLTGCFLFPPINNTTEWTVMIYLDSDNNLEMAGIDDINEMEMVGSTADVNVIVQVDRIPYSVLASNNEGYLDDISNSNWTTTRRYYITQDFDPVQINSPLIDDLGELNMGDPQTLVDFASWAATNYPAKKYLLVIWNHGGGFRSPAYTTKDIAWDNTSGIDRITMPELEYALSAISTQMGKKVDIVGMDACLMAMTEVAYQIKDYADIMVASEESEPGDGWPYDSILAQLVGNPFMSATQLATDIVDKYIFSYPSGNVTQSAIDLSYMDTLAGQLSNLALAIMSDSFTPKSKYILSAVNSQYYGDPDFIDLYDLGNQLLAYSNSLEVKNIILNIQQTLNNSVIESGYSGRKVSNSKGISIYFPWYYGYSGYYNYTNFSQDTFWDEMLLHLGL